MKHRNIKTWWTIVQHNNWVTKGDPQFFYGLEEALVSSPRDHRKVLKAGGLIFESQDEALAYIDQETPWRFGRPSAPGCFSERYAIDGMPIYIPRKKVA